ncbi:hypothetical protein NE237_028006 [Protea cynaroides]|uniref:Uncharacterized protein n=1 Tax=Protea cynaroides TaxID=273540 RepID=A0A9Q0GSY7_9MAGN|nr:hypothetical protein NE237_028006 [Protea cynaroides]
MLKDVAEDIPVAEYSDIRVHQRNDLDIARSGCRGPKTGMAGGGGDNNGNHSGGNNPNGTNGGGKNDGGAGGQVMNMMNLKNPRARFDDFDDEVLLVLLVGQLKSAKVILVFLFYKREYRSFTITKKVFLTFKF